LDNSFRKRVENIIRHIPEGKVATYGRIASCAGVPKGARGVAWILHSCSEKDRLPWHRVVNRKGGISLPPHEGYELQMALLQKEGVRFDESGYIDLDHYGWYPDENRIDSQ
jgi:methylated-DNA-protein-cysteine methyltransferase-like protein